MNQRPLINICRLRKILLIRTYTFIGFLGLGNIALAGTNISVQLPYESFISENLPLPLANDKARCVSTATMNSFVYLANTYPEIYGASRLLTGSNLNHTLAEARDELDGSEFMNGGGCGVSPRDAWEGKLKWLDKYAPGSTFSSGMSPLPFHGWPGESFLTFGLPSFDYLFTQLNEKKSVELVFEYSVRWNS